MQKKLLFIFNPVAGKNKINSYLSGIISAFCEKNYDVHIYASKAKNDMYNYFRKYNQDYELIIVSGGDGSLNEIVNAYMKSNYKPVIGYIPAGTTNDFSKNLDLPADMSECAKRIINGNIMTCDLGLFNRHSYFTYVAAFGSISEISYSTPQASKNILGQNAYVVEGLKQLVNLKKFHLKIEYDGGIIEDDFCHGMVSNSKSIGGIKFYKEYELSLSDGKFECLFIKYPNNPIDMQQIVTSIATVSFNNSHFYQFQTSKLKITSEEKVNWTLDGEYAGSSKTTTIDNCHKVIKFKI